MWRAMYATRISALKLVYSTKAGHDMLKAYAEKEHSSENIDFVDAVVHWQNSADRSTDEAGAVLKKFIGCNAESQVNIGARTQKKLEADFKAANANGTPLALEVFDKAKSDVLKVIEKDTFARFNKDQERMEELFSKEFEEAAMTGPIGELQVVETQFGVHLLLVNGRSGEAAPEAAPEAEPAPPAEKTTSQKKKGGKKGFG